MKDQDIFASLRAAADAARQRMKEAPQPSPPTPASGMRLEDLLAASKSQGETPAPGNENAPSAS